MKLLDTYKKHKIKCANERMLELIEHDDSDFAYAPDAFDAGSAAGKEELNLMARIIRHNVDLDKAAILRGLAENKQNFEQKKRPLFFLSGETHSASAHRVAEMLLMQELQDEGVSIAYGHERPHNFSHDLFGYYKDLEGDFYDQSLEILNMHPVTPSQTELLLANSSAYADWSSKLRTTFLRERNITQAFNDAAIAAADDLMFTKLDMRDVKTRLAIETAGYDASITIHTHDIKGIDVRNQMIVDAAIDHAAWAKAELYIQNCGSLHVVGVEGHHPYDLSLLAAFEKAGQVTLGRPIFSAGWDKTDLPTEACKNNACLTGNTMVGREFYSIREVARGFGRSDTREHEFIYMAGLMAILGMDMTGLQVLPQDEQAAMNTCLRLFTDVEAQLPDFVPPVYTR